jgi:site-specific DNA-methyltransferase (adenine-specific)
MINKVHNKDCVTGMTELPDNYVDLILTSPPYNLNIEYDKHDDSMSLKGYYDWCEKWIEQSYRVLKPGGRFCLQIGCFQSSQNEPTYSTFTELFKKYGFIFREFIIWNKNTIPKRTAWGSWKSPSNPRISPPFEMIINFHKISPKILEKGETDLTKEEFVQWTNGLWVIGPESAKRRGHPAPFPEELAKRCIKMHTYIDGVVLDPFNGSGTTTSVAKSLKRNWIGFDISESYCNLAESRINI